MKINTILLIIVGVFVAILGFDIYLYSDGVPGNSISQVIIHYSEKSMMLPWFIGLVMGLLASHFFDNYKEPRGKENE